jgi:hypothetical protein
VKLGNSPTYRRLNYVTEPGSSLAKVIRHDFLSLSPKESFVLEEKEGQKALILRTSRATVSAILARIDDAVRSLGSSTVSTDQLQGPSATSWSAEELQALGNYTQTLIQKEPASSVSCLTLPLLEYDTLFEKDSVDVGDRISWFPGFQLPTVRLLQTTGQQTQIDWKALRT